MPNFTKLNTWQIKSVYGAVGAGRFTLRARPKKCASRAGHASNKKSGTAYLGTVPTTSTWLHLSTRTASKSCPADALAETPIVFPLTMSDPTNRIKQQPTKEEHNGNSNRIG
jgi:hypothetical protein